MAGGRPRKPVERQRALGNPGKRPLPAPVRLIPAPERRPAAPRSLGRAGKALWRTVHGTANWIAPSDEPLVRLLAEAADERAAWKVLLDLEPLVTTSQHGTRRVHPAVAEIRALERQMTTWLSLLGFTPADRARLALGEVRSVAALADFLDRRTVALAE